MENKIPATVRVLTLNCAPTLRRCLESLKEFGEILIFDGNSTDDTLKIAQQYGARIEKQYPNRNEPNIILRNWAEVVNRATYAATYDWVLYIDSDETASPGLVQEIKEIVAWPIIEHYIYKVPNKIIYEGREILYSLPYPGYQMRFINKKSGAVYQSDNHYYLSYDEKKYLPGVLKNPWYVYVDRHDNTVKKIRVIRDALADKDQTWWEFVRWSIFNKLFGIIKILLKVSLLYLRHGFKETLPPKMELARIKYKGLLFWYLMKQRVFRQKLVMPEFKDVDIF